MNEVDPKAIASLGSNLNRMMEAKGPDVVASYFGSVIKAPKDARHFKFVITGPNDAWKPHPTEMSKIALAEKVFTTAIEKARLQGMTTMYALDYLYVADLEPDRDLLLEGLLNISEREGVPIVGGEVAVHKDECLSGYCVVFIIGFAGNTKEKKG